ncbi:MAG: hypothetical protein VKN33_07050 [Candidatus Sericytochromatia bacterium]|nr:hypothetical protein [Candidatus Sericytochromatia bacterium]
MSLRFSDGLSEAATKRPIPARPSLQVVFAIGFGITWAALQSSAWAAPKLSMSGGVAEFLEPDTVSVWSNSPTSTLSIDNQTGRHFANWRVKWHNCLAGSFVATPEGVVVGTSPEGRPIESTATLQPAERQAWSIHPNLTSRYQFAVFGNLPSGIKQGEHLKALGEAMAESKVQFAVHLGDRTKNQAVDSLQALRKSLPQLSFPTYCVNSQPRSKAPSAWKQSFGDPQLSFRLNDDAFIFIDNANRYLTESQEKWLFETLTSVRKQPTRNIFIFAHVPLIDVRPGINQAMRYRAQVRRLLRAFSQFKVNTFFGGSLGIYASETRDGVRYITTGGAGLRLEAPPRQGGFHHWVKVQVDPDGQVAVAPQRIRF